MTFNNHKDHICDVCGDHIDTRDCEDGLCEDCSLAYENFEIKKCQDCEAWIDSLDIPLCEECQKKYDLNKFWIKHDLEIGNWHEPVHFNENPEVKAMYVLDKELADGVSAVEIRDFIREYKDKWWFEENKVGNATISQIVKEMKGV